MIMTISHEPLIAVNAAKANATAFSHEPKAKQLVADGSIYLPGTDCAVKSKISFATLTSFRVGGPAQWYVSPRNLEELKASFQWANVRNLPVTLVGAGSNLLVSDRGLPGLSIGTRNLRYTHFDPETGTVRAAAGQSLARLAWKAAELGWEGMEWAVGIPGTVGGAVVMNAGAHGTSTAEILVNTLVLDPKGNVEVLEVADLDYGYRTSALQSSAGSAPGRGGDRLVVEATFALKPGADPDRVIANTTEQLEHRRHTQPYHLPSCGSVFRNPEGPHGAGWLVEQTGLKGYRIGGAQVAERHANFILNCGGATANDIFQLIHYVQAQVQKRWSVTLEPEVRILGEFPDL
ncbi:UDP-N-acetylmuramate dehydrogenase [[Phormidium] sp. ETS-05]|uniref:UDP-N-acetylmuramate dehydrogenase n=1 Tax=[Phormidium] sp. ETS-05 TaxID=222819 RepID=UPI0035C8BC15